MPSTRRAFLSGTLGIASIGSLPPTRARSPLTLGWHRKIGGASVADLIPIDGQRVAVVLDGDGPDAVAFDTAGNRLWTWERSSRTGLAFQAGAPTGDSGLSLTRETAADALELVTLDSEGSVAWRATVDVSAFELAAVRPARDRLIVTSTDKTTHSSRTTLYGIDPETRSLAWESAAFEPPESGQPRAEAMFYPRRTRAYRNGYVAGGETMASDPWVARVGHDGAVRWSHEHADAPLDRVDDVVVTADDRVVVAGPRVGDRTGVVRLVAFGPDGERQWTADTGLDTSAGIARVFLARRSGSGLLIAADVYSRSGFVAALTDDRGGVAARRTFHPFEKTRLQRIARVGDRIVLAGGGGADRAWLGVLDTTPTPTPSTPTETRTERSGQSSSTSPTRTRSTTTDTRSPTTDATGPGFGTMAGVLAAVGGGWLATKSGDGERRSD